MANWDSILDEIKSWHRTKLRSSGRISLGRNDSILLDGEEIPYEFLPKAFDVLSESSRYSREAGVQKISKSISVGEKKFTYHRYTNGDSNFTLNGALHCSSGPALIVGGRTEFYNNGGLHNTRGPAIKDGDSEFYYLDGRQVSLSELIEKSPHSEHSWGCRGNQSFYISKLNDHAVIRGLDGTVALLKKSNEGNSVDDFLLEVVGSRLPGYRVIMYENIGPKLRPIYKYLAKDKASWRTDFYTHASWISYRATEGSFASLCLDKDTHKLSFKVTLPDETRREWRLDYSFDDPMPPNDERSFPQIEINRDSSGRLSSRDGPAIKIRDTLGNIRRFYIDGLQISEDEFGHFDEVQNAIVYKDTNGRTHRTDGPAIIDFNKQENPARYWFEDGVLIDGPETLDSREIINSTGTTMPTYTDLNVKQNDMQNKFEEALKRVAKKANAAKSGSNNLGGDGMEIKTTKYGDARASTSDSRVKQVTSGAKLGLQKAALRIGTKKVAEKIVEAASPTDNVVIQRIVQLALLLGTAELAERLPDGAASKVGLTEERREGYGGLARYVAGETLGRDAVDIVGFVAPMLLDKLQGISAEEIAELTADAEEVERQESALATTK
jgi:hypothetical protein